MDAMAIVGLNELVCSSLEQSTTVQACVRSADYYAAYVHDSPSATAAVFMHSLSIVMSGFPFPNNTCRRVWQPGSMYVQKQHSMYLRWCTICKRNKKGACF